MKTTVTLTKGELTKFFEMYMETDRVFQESFNGDHETPFYLWLFSLMIERELLKNKKETITVSKQDIYEASNKLLDVENADPMKVLLCTIVLHDVCKLIFADKEEG